MDSRRACKKYFCLLKKDNQYKQDRQRELRNGWKELQKCERPVTWSQWQQGWLSQSMLHLTAITAVTLATSGSRLQQTQALAMLRQQHSLIAAIGHPVPGRPIKES